MGTAHWSTDYVEHLRTVHFTLITICVALILLATSRSQTEVQIAHSQIQEVGELLHAYDRSWFDAPIASAAKNAPTDFAFGSSQKILTEGDAAKNAPSSINLSKEVGDTLEFNADSDAIIRISFQPEQYAIVLASYDLEGVGKERTLKTRQDLFHAKVLNAQNTLYNPQTLKQFRDLWNLLGDPTLHIEVPAAISTTGYLRANQSLQPVKLKFIKMGKQQTLEFFQGKNHVSTNGGNLGEFSIYSPAQLGDLGDLKIPSFLYHATFSWIGRVGFDRAELLIPISSDRMPRFDGQSVLISHARHPQNWKHGRFDYAFRQLSNITKDYEALDVNTIEQILAGEEKRTGESFEVLGIKFPAENATRWGILLIIGVQIYFWIHLRELSPQLRRNDPGWEVAWIGVYSSKQAKVAMFVSTCVLPVSAALALGIRGLSVSSFAVSYWILLILGALASLILSLLAWTRLPRVNELYPKA